MNHRLRAARVRSSRCTPTRCALWCLFLLGTFALALERPLQAQAPRAVPPRNTAGAAGPANARPFATPKHGGPATGPNANTNSRRNPGAAGTAHRAQPGAKAVPAANRAEPAPETEPSSSSTPLGLDRFELGRTLRTVVFFALISLAPIGLLMVTAFVRINIVLTLLRQALGSPQVPGNQVLTALALLLTALVMWPRGEAVYRRAIEPYAAGRLEADAAWSAAVGPIKTFMVEQIVEHHHEDYLFSLYEQTVAPEGPPNTSAHDRQPGPEAGPERPDDYPLRIVMPAFLLSELTTALLMGFYLYLPFLVIDLVVSAVLATTGLLMLPPSLVSTPAKLVLFVLADGWRLVAEMLLESFRAGSGA